MPLADDRVAFPVAGALLLVNGGGALGDVPAVRDAAPPGGSRRLAAALAPALAQEDVELAAAGAVLVDPLVEPGKADRDDAAAFQPAGNLLGAPVSSSKVRAMFQTAAVSLRGPEDARRRRCSDLRWACLWR